MSKLGRNDQCPCGSGKKFKKCCMNKQQTPHQLTVQEQKDFNELLPKIFDYTKKFDEQLQPIYQRYAGTFDRLKEADARAFSQLLFHWLIFNKPFLEGNRSILSSFIEEKFDAYTNGIQQILNKWSNLQPLLVSVEDKDNDHIVLKDLLNNTAIFPEQTQITNQLTAGEYLIGFLYPTPTGVALGNDAVIIPKHYEEFFLAEWEKLYKQFQENETEQAFLNNHFHAVLGIFTAIASGLFQDKEIGELENLSDPTTQVLDTFYQHIELGDYSYDAVLEAKIKWIEYMKLNDVRVPKPGVYAAVLEYWISKHDHQWTNQTFKQVAEKYSVSPSTVSARFKEVNQFFSDVTERVPHG
ncbi:MULTISPECIES: SEC-C domain-containing protein [Bacillaceae]|uniref:SEC-C domain-containing protein n=1 Tax=Evansella alkalicola TaxID=745819 RepID=A0ABS6JW56_9BACI|nr:MULTISPECIES: SEC-C domain-containing protein [Bacillaceae]MBU9722825.1 SEC-C domain-containing protein [Bacillus alkalicola]